MLRCKYSVLRNKSSPLSRIRIVAIHQIFLSSHLNYILTTFVHIYLITIQSKSLFGLFFVQIVFIKYIKLTLIYLFVKMIKKQIIKFFLKLKVIFIQKFNFTKAGHKIINTLHSIKRPKKVKINMRRYLSNIVYYDCFLLLRIQFLYLKLDEILIVSTFFIIHI